MYLKYYNIYRKLGLMGLLIILSPLLVTLMLNLLSQPHYKEIYDTVYELFIVVTQITAGVLLSGCMFYYYKILTIFSKVLTVENHQKWILFFVHIACYLALITFMLTQAFNYNTYIPHVLSLSSIAIRYAFGLQDIDNNMEELCEEIDSIFLKTT